MIAMALSCSPRLLIADEPTTALDVTIQAQILELLTTLQEEFGMAIIFITHNLGVIAEVADEVAVMYLGRIVEQAGVIELFDNPQHPLYAGGCWTPFPTSTTRNCPDCAPSRASCPIPIRFPAAARSATAVPASCRAPATKQCPTWPRQVRVTWFAVFSILRPMRVEIVQVRRLRANC